MPRNIHPFQHEVSIYIERLCDRLVKLRGEFESREGSKEILNGIRQLEQLIHDCFFGVPPIISSSHAASRAVLVVAFSKAILLEDTKFERIIYNELRKMTNIQLSREGRTELCDAVNRIGNKRVRMSELAEKNSETMRMVPMMEDLKNEFQQLDRVIKSSEEPLFGAMNVVELVEMVEKMLKKEDFDQALEDFEVVAETGSEVVEDEFVLV